MVTRSIKRTCDIVVAGLGLLVSLPVLAAVSLGIRLRLGAPILFKQERPGLDGEPFTVCKFRTMLSETERHGRALSDDERLTAFGKVLRNLSVDELPQFWNVLKGDMSLVGPRPLLTEYLPLYSPEQARRHDVRPGITGLAQVSGRNELPWSRRFELDVWYVDNWSLWLDMKIIARTFRKVLAGDGVSAQGRATVEYFQGSNQDSEDEVP